MPSQASQDGGTGSQPTPAKDVKEVFGLLLDAEDTETPETPPNAEPAIEPAEPEAEPAPDPEPSPDAPADEPAPDEPEADALAEPTPDDLIEITVDGKVEKHTLDELRNGYSRTADYTRKTMALAEERKAFEADRQQAREVRDEYAAALDKLGAVLDTMDGVAEPDWEERKRILPPDQYAAEYTDHQRMKEKRAVVANEQRRVKEEQLREELAARQQLLAGEGQKLVAAIPEWNDPAKRTEEYGHVVSYLRDLGYSPEQIGLIDDHRVVITARKAMMFDKLQTEVAGATEKLRPKIKPATPGAKRTPAKVDPRKVAAARLKKSGRTADAVPIFESLIGE